MIYISNQKILRVYYIYKKKIKNLIMHIHATRNDKKWFILTKKVPKDKILNIYFVMSYFPHNTYMTIYSTYLII